MKVIWVFLDNMNAADNKTFKLWYGLMINNYKMKKKDLKIKTVKIPANCTGLTIEETGEGVVLSFNVSHKPVTGEVLVWNESLGAPLIGFYVEGSTTTAIDRKGNLINCYYGDEIFRVPTTDEKERLMLALKANRLWWNRNTLKVETDGLVGQYVKLLYDNDTFAYARIHTSKDHTLLANGWLSSDKGVFDFGGVFVDYSSVNPLKQEIWEQEVAKLGYKYDSIIDKFTQMPKKGDYVRLSHAGEYAFCKLDDCTWGVFGTNSFISTSNAMYNRQARVTGFDKMEVLSESDWNAAVANTGHIYHPDSETFDKIPAMMDDYFTPVSSEGDLIPFRRVWMGGVVDIKRLRNRIAFKTYDECAIKISALTGGKVKTINS